MPNPRSAPLPDPRRPPRPRLLRSAGAAAVVAAVAASTAVWAAVGAVAAPAEPTVPPGSTLPTAPPVQVPPLLTQQQVDSAVAALDGLVADAMERTGVPGVAVAVVHRDRVVHAEGHGVREVGEPGAVDPDTVFQLASVSKPLASTVVAGVVGRGALGWDDPVRQHDPSFALGDPYVTEHATVADLLSHRSGLHTGAGDLLEDLGFDREYILAHLDQQPLDPFRSSYNYSNFGYTAGAEAAAVATGTAWEDLAGQVLFEPLGMTATSYRHEDYEAAANKAVLHVPTGDGTWEARYTRDADAEAPAGGASSSVRDLAQWVRLQLAGGVHDGTQVIDADALAETHVPHSVSGPPATPEARTGFYGLGWNVSYDDRGRLQIGHSGAFNLGAATTVLMLPGEDLGIVVLTNGHPEGIPEAIAAGFFDVANHGEPTVDWLTFTSGVFAQIEAADAPETDWTQPPADPAPARPLDAYTGTYDNSYYGPLTVTADGGALTMAMGPPGAPTTFPLTHHSGDTFTFETTGENANGLAGALFATGPDGRVTSVRLDFYDREGLGTFTRG
ncbi:serine hydrolase [Geodermatophilus marinus]|uniref:serine hydrolase n=1 Tax=Geodermatophilus sp. LHW52908 TaxID=2303986 RepID=UPI000E3BED79|nr:serine hydrolase [Geodermatophilus sp. LHW52908]RFU21655.1 serine hydrolase [Geodermatophilus sp. LHW52908]